MSIKRFSLSLINVVSSFACLPSMISKLGCYQYLAFFLENPYRRLNGLGPGLPEENSLCPESPLPTAARAMSIWVFSRSWPGWLNSYGVKKRRRVLQEQCYKIILSLVEKGGGGRGESSSSYGMHFSNYFCGTLSVTNAKSANLRFFTATLSI